MKNLVTAVIFALLFLNVASYSQAKALDPDEVGYAMENLLIQVDKLKKQSPRQCPSDYKDLYKNKDLRISMFYGYEDFDERTLDLVHAYTMAEVLKAPCVGTMQACGFKQKQKSSHRIVLTRNIGGKNIIIQLFATSVTGSTYENSDTINGGYWDQARQSHWTLHNFYHELRTSDIVIYSGHSRGGGGLGFEVHSAAKGIFDIIFKAPLRKMTEALRQRPSRLQFFAMMSCKSEEYYSRAVQMANPNLSLLVTTDDITTDDDQSTLGLLNSILGKKCPAEFKDSLKGVTGHPNAPFKYIRKNNLLKSYSSRFN